MRILSALSVSVGLVFVLACGGASVDTSVIAWDGPDIELPPSPEAIQPEIEPQVNSPEDAVEAVTAAIVEATPAPEPTPEPAVDDEVVNKPDTVDTPAPVAAPTPAPVAVGVGQIQLTTGAGIQPAVDGVPMRQTESQGYLAEVSSGKHNLEIRNLLGTVTGSAEVDVSAGRRTRYEWRRRSLSLLGDVASSPMPPAIDWDEVFATDDAAAPTLDGDKQPLQPVPVSGKK